MKTKTLLRFLLASAAFGVLAAIGHAAQSQKNWRSTRPITTFSEAASVDADAIMTMKCDKCKTTMISAPSHVGPPSKGRNQWFAVGSKHTCDECQGEITVMKGKTADSMQLDCTKCGVGAVSCGMLMADKSAP